MQSQTRRKPTKKDRPKLPHGAGSAAFKGKVWWITYRDAADEIHYENSGTDNPAEVRKIMAERALPRARAVLAELERIANEEVPQPDQGKDGASGSSSRPRRGSRGVTKNPGRGTGAKTQGGAQ
jgi:hypothetical protein